MRSSPVLWIEAAQNVFHLPLVEHGDGTAHLDTTLEAGDALLFKYATETPFAQAPG